MMNISSVNTTAGNLSDRGYNSPMQEKIDQRSIRSNQTNITGHVVTNEEKEQAKKAVDRLVQLIQGTNTTVERSVHEGTNHILYKVKDKESGEVIREIPEEKLLDAAARLMELSGILIDEKV